VSTKNVAAIIVAALVAGVVLGSLGIANAGGTVSLPAPGAMDCSSCADEAACGEAGAVAPAAATAAAPAAGACDMSGGACDPSAGCPSTGQ